MRDKPTTEMPEELLSVTCVSHGTKCNDDDYDDDGEEEEDEEEEDEEEEEEDDFTDNTDLHS